MAKIERVGISLETALLEQYDKLIAKQGYENRSEAVRDLIRQSLASEKVKKPDTKAIGGIFIVYDHHATDVSHKLLEMQHHHFLQTISSTHVHLDHHNCLEVIILKGKVSELEHIGEHLTSLKGVKLGKVNIMATEVE
ncbi:MAG: nickel-responsive regulator [Planctomycetes bacterium GWF2_50_10]|nr:MAG: nickel-responsive regulator [Planctomycetes bacterium GWF2_50_10]